MSRAKITDRTFNFFLSEESKQQAETFAIWLAIISFIFHLLLIFLSHLGILPFGKGSDLLSNPISAIYTPFSLILLFEVYLLVYHIPQSTTTYVSKQYEIITLIVVRRLFKDIANINLQEDWFQDYYDLQFTYDILTTIVLFLLIYFFHFLNRKDQPKPYDQLPAQIQKFVRRKRTLATVLVPIIIIMAIYSFGGWIMDLINTPSGQGSSFNDVNSIFFDEFFMLLILTDVLLLLLSFFHTSSFHLVIRNTGFIISTILIRLSFSVDGYMNNMLICGAVLFGVLILWINRKYEKMLLD